MYGKSKWKPSLSLKIGDAIEHVCKKKGKKVSSSKTPEQAT